jgi:hypothetical protein
MPGVARRLVTFLAPPRKVTQRRRTLQSALRVPEELTVQAGSERNSLRSDNVHFSFRLNHQLFGASPRVNIKDNYDSKIKTDQRSSYRGAVLLNLTWLLKFRFDAAAKVMRQADKEVNVV